jgi:2-iminoacetate synthase
LVAVLRIAVPYTGMIISTRESAKMRGMLLDCGISQISGGSRTSVGGYTTVERHDETSQFDVSDTRSLDDVVRWLLEKDHIPSFCTACYREGRTGDRFMSLCKSGKISLCCTPNALMTLKEYLMDYASAETREVGEALIAKSIYDIPEGRTREITQQRLQAIEGGARDFRF